jgi:integrase
MVNVIENITKRKDGRFMGRFIIGYGDGGKTIYQYVYGSSYDEAMKKVIIGKSIEARFISGKSVLVKKVCTEWLDFVAGKVKESTLANYRMKFEKHILPKFGNTLCSELTAESINAFLRQKLSQGLSPSYVRDIAVIFKAMLGYAGEEYDLKLPLKKITLPKCEKKEIKKISDKEQNKLVEYLKRDMDLTAFGILISLLMGLRIGELCALRWDDVDFENGILHINRTVQRVSVLEENRKTKVIVSSPKSGASKRAISIPDCLMKYFKKFRKGDNFFVISGSEKLIEPRTVQYRYKKILSSARVPNHNFHRLRHTFATNCIQNGFDIKTLSNVLGHSSVSLTLNRYVHPDISHERRLMNIMCSLF